MGLLRAIGLSALILGTSQGWADSSLKDALTSLKKVQLNTLKQIQSVDRQMAKLITASARNGAQSPILANAQTTLTELEKERAELLMRQDFYDRLASKITGTFNPKLELRVLLQRSVAEMALAESMSTRSNRSMRAFMTNLAATLQDGVEQEENLFNFIETYMKFSTLKNPKNPSDFLKWRNYSNSQESTPAQPIDKENLGEALEAKMESAEHPSGDLPANP